MKQRRSCTIKVRPKVAHLNIYCSTIWRQALVTFKGNLELEAPLVKTGSLKQISCYHLHCLLNTSFGTTKCTCHVPTLANFFSMASAELSLSEVSQHLIFNITAIFLVYLAPPPPLLPKTANLIACTRLKYEINQFMILSYMLHV